MYKRQGLPSENKNDNQIIYITAELQGVMTDMVIDTGANVSLLDKVEYNRIKEVYKKNIPTYQSITW